MRKMILLALCAGVSGCVSSPKGNVTPVSASDVLRKLACELRAEAERNPAIVNDGWAVTADLEFTSAVGGGIGGSATGKDSISNGSFAFLFPLDYSESVDRVYVQKVAILVRRISPSECKVEYAKSLGGSLGVAEVFAEYNQTRTQLPSGPDAWLQSTSAKTDSFTGSTTFKVTRSFKAMGPTWTLTHLTAGLGLNASDAATNKLVISVVLPKSTDASDTAPPASRTRPQLMTLTQQPEVNLEPVTPTERELLDESLRNLDAFTSRQGRSY